MDNDKTERKNQCYPYYFYRPLAIKIVYRLNKTIEFFGLIMFLFLAIIGLIIFFISLSSDIKQFRKDKKPVSLRPSVIGVVFILIVSWQTTKIFSKFNRPTLIKIFYDGDYNGLGIDFKTNGTYILESSAVGISDYTFGSYKMKGNSIILDEHVTKENISKYLTIRPGAFLHKNQERTKYIVLQSGEKGQIIDTTFIFNVIIDNRKK